MTGIARRVGGQGVAVVLAVVAALAADRGSALAAGGPSCLVVGVDDAATLRLQCGGAPRTLRLASVRAPRPGTALTGGEPYGTQGRDLARGWFVGKSLEVGGGTARLGSEDLRHGLLALGLVEWTGGTATAADAALRAAEREARLAARGLWSAVAWRRHQASVTEPLLVPGLPPLPPAESIGTLAARFPRKDAAQRRAAFAAAVAQLEAQKVSQAASPPTVAKPSGPASRPRRARSSGRR